jgi:hypothetical protein
LLVWEEHEDGAIHFHGFFGQISEKELQLIPVGERGGRPKFKSLTYKYGRNKFQRIDNVQGAVDYLL